ncbi:hypothetical protein GCM10011341_00530 [Frigidibacter albus]|uniref:hypothetical protein n=1 Tax=Frigidibacter albus TaxID=1465486 RepID=UPI0019A79600|nr:hypothetical protein [Frigidibacter albus]GGH42517.1 hypothetical protein GCM10011341_00530 [Frigidibacter albus]
MTPVTRAELDAALPHVLAAPQDGAEILQLCFRPGYGQRLHPPMLRLTRAQGILDAVGNSERWTVAPWMRLEDGSPDPRIQVSILPVRVMDLVRRDRAGTPHPGDTMIADLDTAEANIPTGSLLRAGTAVLRVSDVFNDACVKWKVRYGTEAKDWITAPGHTPLRLRGLLCEVVEDGEVRPGDLLQKA